MYQQFREVLYHGTVSKIDKVDVKKGRDRKDFGKGFYMAVSKSQAVGMKHTAVVLVKYLLRPKVEKSVKKRLTISLNASTMCI